MGFKFIGKNRIVIGGAILCCLIMVVFPEVTATASKEAINLWLNSIVPTLLPFFIVANFLKKTGIVNKISPKVYPFAMALLSGYPMGARIAGDYYRDGCIDRDQLKWILSYSMVTGPAFLIGAVGVEFLGSHKLGVILAVSHYASALVNCTFYGLGSASQKPLRGNKVERSESYYNILTDAIVDSFRSIAIILAYIVMFMIATDLLQFSGIFMFINSPEIVAILKGALEMTVGCNSLMVCGCSDALRTTLASFIITFGGLSVAGQSMSMLRNCDIGFGQICKMKLTQGIISAIIAFSICIFVL